MKSTDAILLICLTALGSGCSGAGTADGRYETEVSASGETAFAGEEATDEVAEGGAEDAAGGATGGTTEEPSDRISIPAHCTMDEVSTLLTSREIRSGSNVLANISFSIDEQKFVSINGQDCSYKHVFFASDDASTRCHTNVSCGDRQYESFVDCSDPNNPEWVLIGDQDPNKNSRWELGPYAGNCLRTGTAGPTATSPTTNSPTTSPTTTSPSTTGSTTGGSTDDGGDWEDDVRDAFRSGGEAMPYSGPIVW